MSTFKIDITNPVIIEAGDENNPTIVEGTILRILHPGETDYPGHIDDETATISHTSDSVLVYTGVQHDGMELYKSKG